MTNHKHLGWLCALALLGCGGTISHQESLANANGSIVAAEEVEAENNPDAAYHLGLAKEQLEEAKLLIEDDRDERAELVLQRAEADADLALVLAREAEVRGQAEQTHEQIRELREHHL